MLRGHANRRTGKTAKLYGRRRTCAAHSQALMLSSFSHLTSDHVDQKWVSAIGEGGRERVKVKKNEKALVRFHCAQQSPPGGEWGRNQRGGTDDLEKKRGRGVRKSSKQRDGRKRYCLTLRTSALADQSAIKDASDSWGDGKRIETHLATPGNQRTKKIRLEEPLERFS